MNNHQALIIADTTIKTDAEGRYYLNDLHKAAGGESRHDTREFLNRESTKELIAELESQMTGIAVNTRRDHNGGTFVCKQLIYTYAMWFSPKFHLKVVEFFDRGQTQGVAVAYNAAADLLANPMKYIEALMGQAKKIEAERDVALQQKASAIQITSQHKRLLVDAMRTLSDVNKEMHSRWIL